MQTPPFKYEWRPYWNRNLWIWDKPSLRSMMEERQLLTPPTSSLYHYTGRLDQDNLIRIIGGEIFYFSNPLDFNDPLDLSPRVIPQKNDEQNVNFSVTAWLPDGSSGSTNVGELPGLADSLSGIFAHLIPDEKGTHRVMCLSENYENALMWAHYANRHRGICVEVDWQKFLFPFPPQKVSYNGVISLSEMGHAARKFSFQVPQLCVKTTEWSYEAEWRFFKRVRCQEDQCFVKATGAVKSIILGAKVSRQDQEAIIDVVCQLAPQVEIWQAHLKDGNLERYAVPRSLSVRNGNLHPKDNVLNFHEVYANYFANSERIAAQLLKYGEAVGVNQLNAFARTAVDFFGAIRQAPEELLRAIQPVLPDMKLEGLPDVYWLAIAAAARNTTSEILKDAVSRWIPTKHLHLLCGMQKADFSELGVLDFAVNSLLFPAPDTTEDQHSLHFARLQKSGALERLGAAEICSLWLYLRTAAICNVGTNSPNQVDRAIAQLELAIQCFEFDEARTLLLKWKASTGT